MIENYKSTKVWSLITLAGFGLIVLFEAFTLLVAIGQVANPASMVDLDSGESMSVWMLVHGTLALFSVPVHIATAVFFLIWLNRSYKNLYALRPTHLEFSSGWAVGYWFVPFIALWRPFQVVREVWWESDPEIPSEHKFLTASLHSAPTYMGFWWAFWIASNVAANVESMAYDPKTADDVFVGGVIVIISCAITIVAAILAAAVVRDIGVRQAGRHRQLATLVEQESDAAALAYQQSSAEGWRSNG
jgi:hypothetical protein